jgi:hypothetical protein
MTSPPETAEAPAGREGKYRMRARLSVAVIVTYGLLLVLILLLIAPELHGVYVWATVLLVVLLLFYLARYLSVSYTLDDTHLRARELFGGRRVPFEEIRAIEYASLRDLSPTGGMFASWIGTGKMYSPSLGDFQMVFTDAAEGLMISAGVYPLYISPRDREAFAKELSRRVRSYTGPLLKDVGFPGP